MVGILYHSNPEFKLSEISQSEAGRRREFVCGQLFCHLVGFSQPLES